MNRPDTTTYEGVKEYFELCKSYWMRNGDSAGVATSKAFWWDLVECSDFDNSWNDAKRKFAKEFRSYTPGDPIPEKEFVERGEV